MGRNSSGDDLNLTKGVGKFFTIFWSTLFVLVALAIGQGPLLMDIARISLTGMFVTVVICFNWPNKMPKRRFLTLEILFYLALLTAGIIEGEMILMLAIALGLLIFISVGCILLERRLGYYRS